MDAGTVLAIYAAVVATGGLAWNLWTWRRARTNVVDIQLRTGYMTMSDGSVGPEIITIHVANRGDRPIRVHGAGLLLQDGSGGQLVIPQPPPGAEIPGTIQPNDSGMTYMLREAAERRGIDMFSPMVGWVSLATGEKVRSKAQRLLSR